MNHEYGFDIYNLNFVFFFFFFCIWFWSNKHKLQDLLMALMSNTDFSNLTFPFEFNRLKMYANVSYLYFPLLCSKPRLLRKTIIPTWKDIYLLKNRLHHYRFKPIGTIFTRELVMAGYLMIILDLFSYFSLKRMLWVFIRSASMRRF